MYIGKVKNKKMTDLPKSHAYHEIPQGPKNVELVEGVDFNSRGDYESVLRAVKARLGPLSVDVPGVLLTGHHSLSDQEPLTPRNSTWAMSLAETERAVQNPYLNHPVMYSGVKKPDFFDEPTITAYDPRLLRRKDREEPDEYVPIPGGTLDTATIARFSLIHKHDSRV